MAIVRRKKKDGTHSYQVVVRRTVHGRRKQVVIGTYRTKKEAVKAERVALEDIDEGRYVSRNAVTVSDLMSQWLQHKRTIVQPRTVSEYESLNEHHVSPSLGHYRIQELDPDPIQEWVDTLPLSDRSRHRSLQILSQAYAYAVRLKMVAANPCQEVVPPKPKPKVHELWTNEQYRAFLAVAEQDAYAGLWHLLCVTGMRFGEAAGLRWRDVLWNVPAVRVQQVVVPEHRGSAGPTIKATPKTKKGQRTIPVGPETVTLLQSLPQDHNLISCYKNGQPLRHSGMVRKLRTLCKQAGVPYLPPHGFRHLHATHLARAGVPLRVAMDRLGIDSPGVLLSVYQQVDQEMQADVVAKLGDLLKC